MSGAEADAHIEIATSALARVLSISDQAFSMKMISYDDCR
jgi:hypothetical protein